MASALLVPERPDEPVPKAMLSMRAVVLREPGRLEVADIPAPALEPGEVMCEVAACGICGSDLRYLAGENPWAKHTLGFEKPNPPNMILGHEVSGVVAMDGGRVRASMLAFVACGQCSECLSGRSHLCRNTRHLGHGAGWEGREWDAGGMAELMPIWRDNVYELPDHISFDEATFLDGLGVAVHAVSRAGPLAGERIVVLGGGPIGLLIIQVALAGGAEAALVADLYDAALECARMLGADMTVDGREVSPAEAVSVVRGWGRASRISAVFDTTGDLELQQQALEMLAPGGTLMLMAGAADRLVLTTAAMAGERAVTTSSNNLREDFECGLELMAAGKVVVGPMITHTFDLEDAVAAFDVAVRKHETGAIKVIIHP